MASLLEKAVKKAEKTNTCLLLLKPHANTAKVRDLLIERLESESIQIVRQGSMDAEEISHRRIIDTHYGSLAAKALYQMPQDHAVHAEARARFKGAFNISWDAAMQQELVCNANEAMQRLGLTSEDLDAKWTPLRMGIGKVKLGGGFYCGLIDGLYVINGFYLAMRKMYTAAGNSVSWFVAEWSEKDLSWERFRTSVIGDTDPAVAGDTTLRGAVHREWRDLQLKCEPHVAENVVHASASPFEALLERTNWAGSNLAEDPFGMALLHRGISRDILDVWRSDPVVENGDKKRSLFDLFENLDSSACIQTAIAIADGFRRSDRLVH